MIEGDPQTFLTSNGKAFQKVDLRPLFRLRLERLLPVPRKRSSQKVELYAERPITKEQDLLDFIKALDEDEGIRLEADLKNHENGGFIFVGFYRGNYCVNICDRVWNPKVHGYVAGGKDEWYYFDTSKEAYRFVVKEAKQPIRAWLY